MSIPLFFTTTTAPDWAFTFADASGNVPNSFTSASFSLKFRSVSTGQKITGGGVFSNPNGTTGQVTYTLSSTDLADAYAVFSPNTGVETFEVFAEATIGAKVYDGLPTLIQIRKI